MRRFFLILAAIAAASCGKGTGLEAPAILRTVPSRSIEIFSFRNAGRALEMLLDSSHVFRSLELGRLKDNEMALSYDYSSTLVPLLAIDAGHARKDTAQAVRQLLAQAEALNLRSAYVVDSSSRKAALLLSPSSASVSEALFHIESGTSILDAPDFSKALALSGGGDGSVFLRNSAAGHLLPADFMKETAPRRALVRFLSGACEWTVVNFSGGLGDEAEVAAVGDSPRNYLQVIEGQQAAKSEIGALLPSGTVSFVDLPLKDAEAFYNARCAWLDANSLLQRHKAVCRELEKSAGRAPADWLRNSRPQEIARIVWDGGSVLALRCHKTPSVKELSTNDIQGFPAAIFGDAFSLPDESACARLGRWLIVGSADEVASFCTLEDRAAMDGLSGSGLKFAVYNAGNLLQGGKNGTKLKLKR